MVMRDQRPRPFEGAARAARVFAAVPRVEHHDIWFDVALRRRAGSDGWRRRGHRFAGQYRRQHWRILAAAASASAAALSSWPSFENFRKESSAIGSSASTGVRSITSRCRYGPLAATRTAASARPSAPAPAARCRAGTGQCARATAHWCRCAGSSAFERSHPPAHVINVHHSAVRVGQRRYEKAQFGVGFDGDAACSPCRAMPEYTWASHTSPAPRQPAQPPAVAAHRGDSRAARASACTWPVVTVTRRPSPSN